MLNFCFFPYFFLPRVNNGFFATLTKWLFMFFFLVVFIFFLVVNGYLCFTSRLLFSLIKYQLCRHYIIIKVSESARNTEITVGLNILKSELFFFCSFSSCGLLLLFTLCHTIRIILSFFRYIQYSNWQSNSI